MSPAEYRIVIAPEAYEDLDEIWDYIEDLAQDPALANRYITRLLASVENLTMFPESRPSLADVRPGYHYFQHEKKIVVVFEVVAEAVHIVAFYSSRQNWRSKLRRQFGQ